MSPTLPPPYFLSPFFKTLSPTLQKLMNWIMLSPPHLSSDPDNPSKIWNVHQIWAWSSNHLENNSSFFVFSSKKWHTKKKSSHSKIWLQWLLTKYAKDRQRYRIKPGSFFLISYGILELWKKTLWGKGVKFSFYRYICWVLMFENYIENMICCRPMLMVFARNDIIMTRKWNLNLISLKLYVYNWKYNESGKFFTL